MRISDWSSDVCSSDLRWYGDKQSYNLWKNAMEVKGCQNIQDYIVDPESLPPEEPNPLQKAELDEKRTNIDVAKRRSEEHTSELQSLMRISYDVFCLRKQIYAITLLHFMLSLSYI